VEISLSKRPISNPGAELLVLATTAARWSDDIALLDRVFKGLLRRASKRAEFKGTDGSTLLFQTHGTVTANAIVLVGVDPIAAPRTWHQVADIAVRQARETKSNRIAIAFGRALDAAETIASVSEAVILSAYRFDRYKSKAANAERPTAVQLLVQKDDLIRRQALARGRLLAAAPSPARARRTHPPADITPNHLASAARRLARRGRLRVRVFDERALARAGMGAILGVGQGSARSPRLIELVYRPRRRGSKRIAIVGKGITFDSGGLSLKHAEAMQGQKRDMAGGAAVLGVMSVIASLAPSVEVRAYVASAENMPDGRAIKPGDVLRAYNGKTIEVLNTDAEGRLVLADALAYAAKAKPDVIIDLATLTAAVGAALGRRYAGIMGTDADLTRAIIAAGRRAGENLWELPLVEEYRADIDSRVADLKNTGEGYAGTIIGGLFLREFVAGLPWAHIDFSSTVVTDKPFPAHPAGATGFGVRTLLQYITGL
jgi:leucyl aminopeptidase